MKAKIMKGQDLALQKTRELKLEIQNINPNPQLAVIQVGEDEASNVYVANKKKFCELIGIIPVEYKVSKTITQQKLAKIIEDLNQKNEINGILVQLPLPQHIDTKKIINLIKPIKDVDGFHPENIGKLMQNKNCLRPCTPKGIMALLAEYNINTKGMHAVIIGASNIVGKPMALELINAEATVTICHEHTQNLTQHTQVADIIIIAIGSTRFLKKEMVKEGVIVIDVGINRDAEGKVTGDVDFNEVAEKASYISPVPKGVGPMTVAALMENTLEAYKLQNQ